MCIERKDASVCCLGGMVLLWSNNHCHHEKIVTTKMNVLCQGTKGSKFEILWLEQLQAIDWVSQSASNARHMRLEVVSTKRDTIVFSITSCMQKRPTQPSIYSVCVPVVFTLRQKGHRHKSVYWRNCLVCLKNTRPGKDWALGQYLWNMQPLGH